MKPGPPRILEAVVAFLIPPARREHVLGDLHERYKSPGQYLVDALRTVPLVIFSQVRRSDMLGPLLVVVFLGFLGRSAIRSGRVLDRISGAAILAAALFVAYQVLQRTWAAGAPRTLRQLKQRRDDLRRIWSWFLAPVTGALVVFAVRLPLGQPDQVGLWLRIAPFLTISLLWSLLMWRQARREARRLQLDIDRLGSP